MALKREHILPYQISQIGQILFRDRLFGFGYQDNFVFHLHIRMVLECRRLVESREQVKTR